jgi:hypothetical protein
LATRPTVSGYHQIEDGYQWGVLYRRPVMIVGSFIREIGLSGQDYLFVFRPESLETNRATQSLLVSFEGPPDPNWRPGSRLIIYGTPNGFTDLLGTRLPLMLADGITAP